MQKLTEVSDRKKGLGLGQSDNTLLSGGRRHAFVFG